MPVQTPESGPKLPIVSLRLPTARQKIDQGWSLEALNWDNLRRARSKSGRKRAERANYKPNRGWMVFKNEKQNENYDCDYAYGDDLPIQIRFGAFLNRG